MELTSLEGFQPIVLPDESFSGRVNFVRQDVWLRARETCMLRA
jgi:hypothetical protein